MTDKGNNYNIIDTSATAEHIPPQYIQTSENLSKDMDNTELISYKEYHEQDQDQTDMSHIDFNNISNDNESLLKNDKFNVSNNFRMSDKTVSESESVKSEILSKAEKSINMVNANSMNQFESNNSHFTMNFD